MKPLTSTWSTVTGLATHPTTATIAAALVAAAVLTLIGVLAARKPTLARRWLVAASFAMSLAINAEGMWVVATQKLKLPAVFAGGVFSVFETILLTEMALASDQYRRTTVRDTDGKIVKAGHPGKHGRAVFVIAIMSGVIVAFNAKSAVELALRVWLPIAVTMLWWNVLTAEGTGRPTSRLAWTPTRIAERIGLLVPDINDDLAALARERKIRAIVNVGQRVDGDVWPVALHRWRLTRLARTADDGMVAEARDRLDRAIGIMTLLRPSAPGDTDGRITEVTTSPTPQATAPEPLNDVPTEGLTAHVSKPVSEDLNEDLTGPATGPLGEAVTHTAARTSPDPAVKSSPKTATAVKIAKLRARKPTLTQVGVVRQTGLSLSTVQRNWADTTPPTNGNTVPNLISD